MGISQITDVVSEWRGLNRLLFKGSKRSGAYADDEEADQGIRGGPQSPQQSLRGRRGPRHGGGGGGRRAGAFGRFDDTDGIGIVSYSARGAQLFLSFIGICINAGNAYMQTKWDTGPSGLVVFTFLLLTGSFFTSLFMLIIPILYAKKGTSGRLARGLQLPRPAFAVNGLQCILLVILGFTFSISANVKGCKSPDQDQNADKEGYVDILADFCRNKRALAAFIWFTFLAWVVSLAQVFISWRQSRSLPTIPAFRPPDEDDDKDTWNDNADIGGNGMYHTVDAAESARGHESERSPHVPHTLHSSPSYRAGGFGAHAYNANQGRQSETYYEGGRPFDNPTPRGFTAEPAPTYEDPYERIRRERMG